MASVFKNGQYVEAVADVSEQAHLVTSTTAEVVVPAGESWLVLSAVATITTNATVGNRTHALQVVSGSDVIDETVVGANLAASQTGAKRRFLQSASSATGELVPLRSSFYAPAGTTIRVFDKAAIDAVDPADTMVLSYLIVLKK